MIAVSRTYVDRAAKDIGHAAKRTMADALEQLMDDEALRKEMGENSRRLAEDRFDRDKSYEKIADFVRTVYEEHWK